MRRLLVILAGTAATALLTCASAWATFPGANGRIAFVNENDDDIWTVNPDGTSVQNLTPHTFDNRDPAWSPDGTRIAFASNRGVNFVWDIWVMNADGGNPQQLTTTPQGQESGQPAWSPDGTRLVYLRISKRRPLPPGSMGDVIDCDGEIRIMTLDGSADAPLAIPEARSCPQSPDWSPDGRYIAFRNGGTGDAVSQPSGIAYVRPDGTGFVHHHSRFSIPHWSPGNVWITPDTAPDDEREYFDPVSFAGDVWSPDGSWKMKSVGSDLVVNDERGGGRLTLATSKAFGVPPDWQPLPPTPTYAGYPRPVSASPMRVSIVPAYQECFEPNQEHGPPLAHGSCAPPAQTSDYLTVGNVSSNGHPTESVGSLALRVSAGDPSTPGDQADVRLIFKMSGVRCRIAMAACESGALSDYTGQVEIATRWRITDRFNSGLGTQPATMEIPEFQPAARFAAPCAATPPEAGDSGARCELTTTLDTISPGQIREGSRAVWATDQLRVWDGGPDGSASTDDNTVFAVQGIFIP